MKPPPYTPEKFVKLTLLARPLRVNTLAHWSALVAHAPVSSKAFACCGNSKQEQSAVPREDPVSKHNHRLSLKLPPVAASQRRTECVSPMRIA
jgi:hypothetical protein